MKIALGQLQLYWEDKKANLGKAEEYLSLMKGQNIDLFLLPEMSLTGFSMHTERTKEKEKETVHEIQRLAESYQVSVGVGWVKDAGKLCENHYSIVTPKGEILDYTKIHPFRFAKETEYFQGGNALPVCDYKDFRIGVQICYDLRFPEPFQILSRQAELIVVPANWPAARSEHWKCLLKARAIENMVYIAGINCGGEMDGVPYTGDSAIYAPDGTMLKPKLYCLPDSPPSEQVQIYELGNDVSWYRACFPMKEDRRESLYQNLQKEMQMI